MPPLYEDRCTSCGHTQEELRSASAPQPEHCGQPMQRVFGFFVTATTTRNGKLVFGVQNSRWKGNRKPKTIGRGHGLGGKRKPPTMAKMVKLARGKR